MLFATGWIRRRPCEEGRRALALARGSGKERVAAVLRTEKERLGVVPNGERARGRDVSAAHWIPNEFAGTFRRSAGLGTFRCGVLGKRSPQNGHRSEDCDEHHQDPNEKASH